MLMTLSEVRKKKLSEVRNITKMAPEQRASLQLNDLI